MKNLTWLNACKWNQVAVTKEAKDLTLRMVHWVKTKRINSLKFIHPEILPPESSSESVAIDLFNYYTAQVVNAVVSLIEMLCDVSAFVPVDFGTVQVEPGFERILCFACVLSIFALSTIQQVNNTWGSARHTFSDVERFTCSVRSEGSTGHKVISTDDATLLVACLATWWASRINPG